MLLEFNVVIVYVRTSQIYIFQQARAISYGYTPEQHFARILSMQALWRRNLFSYFENET
jgi:hypothetical protein